MLLTKSSGERCDTRHTAGKDFKNQRCWIKITPEINIWLPVLSVKLDSGHVFSKEAHSGNREGIFSGFKSSSHLIGPQSYVASHC